MLLLIAMATACADSADMTVDDFQPVPSVDDAPDVSDASALRASLDQPSEPSVCDLLPNDDSACAHACDPDAVEAAIPPGTCAVLECPLTDGTTYRTGGCNTP